MRKKIFLPNILESIFLDFYLLFINIRNSFYNFYLFIIEVLKFYRIPLLRKIDIELFRIYAFKDQFTISGEESKKLFTLDEEELTYGEGIWSSMKKVMDIVSPKKGQVFVDLGCGAGRICFFVNIFYSLETHGIDLIKPFIDNAEKVVNKYNLPNIYFYNQNWLTYDLSNADIIYITATCLDDDTAIKLTDKLENLNSGVKIISVSLFIESDKLKLLKRFKLPFSWGKATVFLFEKK